MGHSYEIEIKSLLGSKERADALLKAIQERDESLRKVGENSQLNHYFVGGDREKIKVCLEEHLSLQEYERLEKIFNEATALSIRTRKAEDKVLFVLKASIDDTTSENGTARVEFEAEVKLEIDQLDALLVEAGCGIQAKWSRDRREYEMQDGTHVCLDRNAGYGYVAEFERIVEDESQADTVKEELRSLMEELGVTELPQDRLERMFAHYNAHWKEYYGTDKVFEIA